MFSSNNNNINHLRIIGNSMTTSKPVAPKSLPQARTNALNEAIAIIEEFSKPHKLKGN